MIEFKPTSFDMKKGVLDRTLARLGIDPGYIDIIFDTDNTDVISFIENNKREKVNVIISRDNISILVIGKIRIDSIFSHGDENTLNINRVHIFSFEISKRAISKEEKDELLNEYLERTLLIEKSEDKEATKALLDILDIQDKCDLFIKV